MEHKATLIELLSALTSSENEPRKKAETMYQQAKQADPDQLMVGMLGIVAGADVDESVRCHAAVLLHRLVTRGPEKDFLFPRLTPQKQQGVAAELLRLFEQESSAKLQRKVGNVIAKLAEHVCDESDPRGHLDQNGWSGLLPVVFRMADASANANEDSCDCAIKLLQALVPTMKTSIVGAKQQLGQVLQVGLAHPSLKIKTAVLLLICEVVCETDKKAWTPLLATLGALVQVLQQLATSKEEDLLQQALQAMIEVASREAEFFKAQLAADMEPAKFMATVAKSRDQFEESGLRCLALEWLTTFLEKKNKWVTKNQPAFVALTMEVCMELMLDVEDGEEELAAWAARMDDEECDDDDDLYSAGEETIDRVVGSVDVEVAAVPLFQLIQLYSSKDAWQARHAALTAIRQTIEYVEERQHVEEMAKLLLAHLEHPHPRVRFTALLALGQLSNDQAPHFQEASHKTVLPLLMQKMDDPVDRVAAMAMGAFVSFCEEMDKALMMPYAKGFMEKLAAKLQSTQHRGVREESITSIAVVAGVMQKEFSQYYDGMMPVLKQFVMHATGEKESRLRGKSFECMSLLGIAVGKEKFLPDAREAITEMMKTQMEADDVQRDYIKEASERICQCLKRDFAIFLPSLLPGIFRSLKLEDSDDAGAESAVDMRKDDDDYLQVSIGDGKVVCVHSSKFEEVLQGVQLLYCFADEMGAAYFDWVPGTAEVLLPLLSATDEVSYLCDEVRNVATQTWALLIKSARQGAIEKGLQNSTLARDLMNTGLQQTFNKIDKDADAETLSAAASAATECIKSVGPGVLSEQEVRMLAEKIFALIDQSFERTSGTTSLRREAGASKEAGDDEDEKEVNDEEEEQCRRNYEEMLGAVMQVAPAEFLPLLPQCAERIGRWIGTKENKVLALYLACDLVNHLREQSEPAWPVFMQEVFKTIGDSDMDAATAAIYAVNLAAPLKSFTKAAPEAFRRIAAIITGPKPKKRNDKARLRLENAVAALLSLARDQSAACPAEVRPWDLILGQLPLKDDEDEAKKVHERLAQLVVAQHEGLLGGAARTNLSKVLSILAEVYQQESICNKETEALILQIFKALPRDILQMSADKLSEKQQRKIEKMLTA
eukprot:TRINITY_DN20620_c1_g1_i1.p1 TRINITY_DN20620_c1_g1~~TRINITY_DN20620_c1_g1_i1.p1  ORF type:complete len:1148 (+),score=364.28 TRINITY_DN20620_c1_g1_i1:100-3444(+)